MTEVRRRVLYETPLSRFEKLRLVLILVVVLSIPTAGLLFIVFDRPRPPSPPSGVPATAHGFLQDVERNVYWWGQCQELQPPNYRCSLFGQKGEVVVSGEYVARAGPCRGRSGSTHGRLPYANEYLEFRNYEADARLIRLTVPCGGYLEPLQAAPSPKNGSP